MNTLLNKDIPQCAMDADFDNHFQETKMTKDLHGVEIKHPHASSPHTGPVHHSVGGHGGSHPPHHTAPAVHYHTGPEHHHYHAPERSGHFVREGTHPHHPFGGHPRQVEHMRHHYNIIPHWNVDRPRPWRADHTPWQDEGGIWHSDHKVFIDSDGVWWDDYGRFRDESGFWHVPDEPGEIPQYHPFDNLVNQVIQSVAEKVAEAAEPTPKNKAEGEKND